MSTTQTPSIIIISGTNASGKSSLGLELAQKYNGEIISADSRQIFCGFDLCCGKVTAAERETVVHHMLDVCKVGDFFTVSDYQQKVYDLIEDIHSRGKQPFIVGGTGLYIDSVVKGYTFEDESIDSEYRQNLEAKSVSELQKMLSDDASNYLKTNHSDYNNKRRLIRIIEKEKNGNSLFSNNTPRYRTLEIGVTWPTELLHKRIDERLSTRIHQGMIEEVQNYLSAGGDPHVMYNLGLEYKFITWYLEGKYTSISEFSINLSTAIKQFSKRQVKWFKRNPNIHWVDMTKDPFAESCNLIDAFLNGTT